MKLKNMIAYIKRKQFYFALFTCCVTLFLIAILVWAKPKVSDKEIANLNGEVINNEESTENLPTNLVENEDTNQDTNEGIKEEETVETSAATNPITISTEEVVGEEDVVQEETEPEPVEEPKEVVIEIAPVVKPNISFDAKEKMIWPVIGSVLKDYSIETPIYFETLEEYTINPALFIASDIGTEVKVAAEGIVETTEYTPETGRTVTIYHGSGYKTIYGQLKKQLLIKEGDLVKKGQVIGHIETPSQFHVLLNPHLYFKVMHNNDSVNPADMIE